MTVQEVPPVEGSVVGGSREEGTASAPSLMPLPAAAAAEPPADCPATSSIGGA